MTLGRMPDCEAWAQQCEADAGRWRTFGNPGGTGFHDDRHEQRAQELEREAERWRQMASVVGLAFGWNG